jgi:oxygen-independent coproporphyrinogen III oxidase
MLSIKMSGIYIHIPFCKQACHYCNFHFSTSMKYKDEMINSILKEIELQKDYLQGDSIQTIYFGGGTPSLLTADEILRIIEQIQRFHHIEANAEITLEANPDDLTKEKIKTLRQTPINRFSIGIQSFHASDLTYMNRAHNAIEALNCIKNAQDLGFDNLTIDLIYGTPTMNDDLWQANLDIAFGLDIPHISSYALTVEPNTALDHFVKKGKAQSVDDEQAARQFLMLMSNMEKNGFDHYEISNFAKPNHYAVHNSNYWKGLSYLGLGPSAHSFNGHSRQWNVAHNMQYIQSIGNEKVPFEVEILSADDQYNEYVMTGLRTIWGIDMKKIKAFGTKYEALIVQKSPTFIDLGLMEIKDNQYALTKLGKLQADGIASDLFAD